MNQVDETDIQQHPARVSCLAPLTGAYCAARCAISCSTICCMGFFKWMARSSNPVRLLITAAIIYALLAPASNFNVHFGNFRFSLLPTGPPEGKSSEELVKHSDVFGILQYQWELKRGGFTQEAEVEAAVDRYKSTVERFGEPLSFLSVFLLASLLAPPVP